MICFQQAENTFSNKQTKNIIASFILASLTFSNTMFMLPNDVMAKSELPSLDKCFSAVRKELDAEKGESLIRLKNDIDQENWEDLILFTREYDAGFRGGVLKNAWKQLGNKKQDGIAITNSFTFDLIALNKAARNKDKDISYQSLNGIIKDLNLFLTLENTQPISPQ